MPSLPSLIVEIGRSGWILGQAGSSELGTTTYLGYATWEDITSKVLSASIRRGRQHELDRIETGRAALTLLNQDGAFNPTNTTSPYWPDIRPMVPLRIRAIYGPEQVAGLVAWYDFSDISTLWQDTARTTPITADAQIIKGVTDKSASAAHLSEATNGPAYKTAIQNGLSVARFDGTDDQLTAADVTNHPFSIIVVGKVLAAAVNKYFVSTGGAFGVNPAASGYDMSAFNGATLNSTKNSDNTAYHIRAYIINGASSALYEDGGAAGGSGDAGSNSPTTVVLANHSGGFFNCEQGEVLIYNSALTVDNLNVLGAYLGTKWGTTWTTAV